MKTKKTKELEPSPYRHYYLYAKHWYKRTDVIEDLKTIQGKYCGMDRKYITVVDIINILTTIVSETFAIEVSNRRELFSNKKDIPGAISYILTDILNSIGPDQCWKYGYYTKEYTGSLPEYVRDSLKHYDYHTAIVYKFLGILNMTAIIDNDKQLINLDEPDSDILPLNKDIIEFKAIKNGEI